MVQCGADEPRKQRMRAHGPRLQLGMELDREEPRVVGQLDDLDQLVKAGLVISGTFQGGRLVEIIELPDHPWFVASQFHPEFKSRPTRPAPLFRDFVGAARERARERAGMALETAP